MAKAENEEYKNAYDEYSKSIANYEKSIQDYKTQLQDYKDSINRTDEEIEKYRKSVDEYEGKTGKDISELTGEGGYKKALGMATQGANVQAGAAANQTQNAYRSAGLSKAQAANLAAGQQAQAYQNLFGNQQSQATAQNESQLSNRMAASNTALGNRANIVTQKSGIANQYGNYSGAMATGAGMDANTASMRGQGASMQQAEGQNEYDRKWGNVGNTLGVAAEGVGLATMLSDERMKDAVNISKDARGCSNRISEILKPYQKKDYKSLIYKRGNNE